MESDLETGWRFLITEPGSPRRKAAPDKRLPRRLARLSGLTPRLETRAMAFDRQPPVRLAPRALASYDKQGGLRRLALAISPGSRMRPPHDRSNAPRVEKLSNELWKTLRRAPPILDEALAASLADKVKALVLAGADPEQERPDPLNPERPWDTALSFALRRRWELIALALIPFCDPLLVCRQSQHCDLLMDAATQPQALAALLARGADATRSDDFGRSALMYALRFDQARPGPHGLRESVRLLLPASDPNAVDVDGQTLEDWAGKNAQGPIPAELYALLSRREAALLLSCADEPGSKARSTRL